ncbi:MAG: hypothetical protein A2Y17_06725 [Clostridiales bacterium GWF2_38_85]|nr:MAG: hypothetical protein A2Y17_06725 [Clostridiales bacterium GWF2_38_85]HBL84909.1 histidinol phosphate phosphatase [Clostridiales bacterium]
MTDCHIHIERGPYTLDWINKFINKAVEQGLSEIWLLEHSYRFIEFLPMYNDICANNSYIKTWLAKKGGVCNLSDYLHLIDEVRNSELPIKIKFGLEICYFKNSEEFIGQLIKNKGFDFTIGSIHFIDHFAYDHKPEFWDGVDVDEAYKRYFETSIDLAKSRVFDGIAHPDCIKLYGHKPTFELTEYYNSLAAELAKSDMYAEQNSGSSRRTNAELGMSVELIKAIKANKIRIITASDAHCPEDVGYKIRQMEEISNATKE